MKMFYAQLNDGSTMKHRADRMEIENESIRVYFKGEAVIYLDLSTVLYAHVYGHESNGKENVNENHAG